MDLTLEGGLRGRGHDATVTVTPFKAPLKLSPAACTSILEPGPPRCLECRHQPGLLLLGDHHGIPRYL